MPAFWALGSQKGILGKRGGLILMGMKRIISTGSTILAVLALSACGGGSLSSGKIFGGGSSGNSAPQAPAAEEEHRDTIWDLFANVDDPPNTTVEVNRYLWNASMDVLNFMPVEAADPFSGIIVFGYGTPPPGGGRAYKATVHITDPALDARALNVALITRGGGTASGEATRAIEDAILTRARQMRIADGNL